MPNLGSLDVDLAKHNELSKWVAKSNRMEYSCSQRSPKTVNDIN
jgi:hypothetical protein